MNKYWTFINVFCKVGKGIAYPKTIPSHNDTVLKIKLSDHVVMENKPNLMFASKSLSGVFKQVN